MRLNAILPLMLIIPTGGDSPAQATPPTVIVNGPEVATPGELLTFRFGESKGSDLKFRVVVESDPPIVGRLQWKHDSPTATEAQVASFPGRHRVRITAFNAEGIDEWERILVIPGNPPCPPPGPKPIDPPGPIPEPTPPAPTPPKPPGPVPTPVPVPIPAGEFGISPKVADIVRKIVDPAKAATAKSLADAADAIAAQIAAGTLTGVNDLLTRVGEAIKATGNPAWQAAAADFSKELAATYAAHKGGRLAVSTFGGFKDAAGWAALMREVATGVRAGAK